MLLEGVEEEGYELISAWRNNFKVSELKLLELRLEAEIEEEVIELDLDLAPDLDLDLDLSLIWLISFAEKSSSGLILVWVGLFRLLAFELLFNVDVDKDADGIGGGTAWEELETSEMEEEETELEFEIGTRGLGLANIAERSSGGVGRFNWELFLGERIFFLVIDTAEEELPIDEEIVSFVDFFSVENPARDCRGLVEVVVELEAFLLAVVEEEDEILDEDVDEEEAILERDCLVALIDCGENKEEEVDGSDWREFFGVEEDIVDVFFWLGDTVRTADVLILGEEIEEEVEVEGVESLPVVREVLGAEVERELVEPVVEGWGVVKRDEEVEERDEVEYLGAESDLFLGIFETVDKETFLLEGIEVVADEEVEEAVAVGVELVSLNLVLLYRSFSFSNISLCFSINFSLSNSFCFCFSRIFNFSCSISFLFEALSLAIEAKIEDDDEVLAKVVDLEALIVEVDFGTWEDKEDFEVGIREGREEFSVEDVLRGIEEVDFLDVIFEWSCFSSTLELLLSIDSIFLVVSWLISLSICFSSIIFSSLFTSFFFSSISLTSSILFLSSSLFSTLGVDTWEKLNSSSYEGGVSEWGVFKEGENWLKSVIIFIEFFGVVVVVVVVEEVSEESIGSSFKFVNSPRSSSSSSFFISELELIILLLLGSNWLSLLISFKLFVLKFNELIFVNSVPLIDCALLLIKSFELCIFCSARFKLSFNESTIVHKTGDVFGNGDECFEEEVEDDDGGWGEVDELELVGDIVDCFDGVDCIRGVDDEEFEEFFVRLFNEYIDPEDDPEDEPEDIEEEVDGIEPVDARCDVFNFKFDWNWSFWFILLLLLGVVLEFSFDFFLSSCVDEKNKFFVDDVDVDDDNEGGNGDVDVDDVCEEAIGVSFSLKDDGISSSLNSTWHTIPLSDCVWSIIFIAFVLPTLPSVTKLSKLDIII